MKSLFAGLLLFMCLSGLAQNDKRATSVRQQLAGLWQLDISRDPAAWENNMQDIPFIQFLEGDRLAVISANSVIIAPYDVAFSLTDTFLIADDFYAKIKSTRINQKWEVTEILFDEIEVQDKLIKIGSAQPMPITLSNTYEYKGEKGWTVYPPLSMIPHSDLELNEDLSFQWDSLGSGTWKLDSLQAKLYFQTTENLFVYEILKIQYTSLVLRPQGSRDPDSVINLTDPYIDSIRAADSTMAATMAYEAAMAIQYGMDQADFESEFCNRTWATIPPSDSGILPHTFFWDQNGDLIIKQGKKTKKYRWELLVQDQFEAKMKLIHSGDEALCFITFHTTIGKHQVTLVDPFSGKLQTFQLYSWE